MKPRIVPPTVSPESTPRVTSTRSLRRIEIGLGGVEIETVAASDGGTGIGMIAQHLGDIGFVDNGEIVGSAVEPPSASASRSVVSTRLPLPSANWE